MSKKIYEQILKNSEEGFIKIKGQKDNNGDYIDFDIIDYNDSFIEILKKISRKNNLNINNIKKMIDDKFESNKKGMNISKFLMQIEKNEFGSINFGEKLCGINLKVDGYYLENAFIFICKLNFKKEIFKFAEMLDTSNGIYFWVKDRKGNYITVNQTWLDEVGFLDRTKVEGMNTYDIWPKEESDNFRDNEKEVINDNMIKIFEETYPLSRGDTIVDTILWPLLDDNNNSIGTIGLAINRKNRAGFYENLNKNEKTFKEITKYCESVFFIRDEENIIYMSPSYETVFEESCDYYEHDVYRFNDFFKSERQPYGILENYEFDKLNEGMAKAKLKNNKEKWIQYKFLPIHDEYGKTIKRIGILTDVTKDVNLQEEKEKIRLDFFANISHELRTPVNLILSSIQVLKLRLENLDIDDYSYFSKYINIMQQNTFRLIKLINNLIDSTKIDSESIEMHPINTDIVSFIEDTCLSVIHFIKSKNMNLIFDTDTEEEIISFDPDLIERVILNLLSNAIKFNKQNGTIFINLNVNQKDVVVEVKDEGVGIPKDKISTIFDRFEQVRTKMKSEREGSGIGLYIVKSLIHMHGGTVKINSEEGKGCSIIFTLPRRISENKTQHHFKYEDNKINMMDVEFSDIYV
ncbi:sensor histidine kinase [Intestinibacter sp.]|uniref:sensor histidine kinase n=1 Tax=Intestinibacter sp. TaxID=1965304 RepID=UPI002A91E846|nr:ATP-binding protein [Intestinibacter sp.]MDY5213208.1 ATP-binding protein [Intestinibacter sp.]